MKQGAADIINLLDLCPHPEGGYYRETWVAKNEGRPAGTCIYFLLNGGENNHWHRVDATEIWHFHAGDPRDQQRTCSQVTPLARTVSPWV